MIQHRIKIEIDGETCGDFTINEDTIYYPATITSPSGATINMTIRGATYNQHTGLTKVDDAETFDNLPDYG